MGADDVDDDAQEEVHDRWAARTPSDVVELLDGYPGTWWIAGGWAIEAFTGVPRDHSDTDPCILRDDLDRLLHHVGRTHEVWSAAGGVFRPQTLGVDLPDRAHQVWLRRGPARAWEFDVLLAPGSNEEWVYRRDESLRMPMTAALWHRDGVRYLRPEIQLLYKAKGLRPKDQRDFDLTVPLLDDARRAWLADALRRTVPGHPWLAALGLTPPR